MTEHGPPTVGFSCSQREIKRGPLPRCALRPDAAAVPADDAMHGGQSDARAGKLRARVQSLECAEQFPGIGHVKTRAVVAHEISRLGSVPLHAELNAGARDFTGE